MNTCIVPSFENEVEPLVGPIVTENFFGEEYPSPEETPSYISTFISDDTDKSLNQVIYDLGDKMLKIGDNFISYLNSFSNLRFERENAGESKSSYHKISGYKSEDEKYYLIGDTDNGTEIIGALPVENSKYPNTKALIDAIRNKVAQGKSTIVNKSKLSKLISNSYSGKIKNTNPLSLSKYESSATVQTLQELKNKYKENYPFIFSSPYIVTGKFNLQENYSGRSIILYNKFPSSKETVDEIIHKYGYSRSVQDKMLGIIPLNNSVYTSLNDLLEDIDQFTDGEIDYSTKMFVSSPSLNQFSKILQTKNESAGISSDLHIKLTNFYNNVSTGNVNGTVEFKSQSADPKNFVEYLKSIRGTDFFNQLNTILEEATASKNNNFSGLFINPLMIKRGSDLQSGLAKIDNHYTGFLDNRLKISGLSPNVVQPQRMEFLITDAVQDITNLFNLEYSQEIANTTPVNRFNYTSKKAKNLGTEVHPSTAKLLEKFQNLGITSFDLNLWVKSITSKTLLNSDNVNFTRTLEETLNELTKNNQDCI